MIGGHPGIATSVAANDLFPLSFNHLAQGLIQCPGRFEVALADCCFLEVTSVLAQQSLARFPESQAGNHCADTTASNGFP